MAEGQKEIRCLAGETRGLKDRAGVVAQHFQPIADVIGMAHGWLNRKLRAQKGAGHFGDKFFAGVAR